MGLFSWIWKSATTSEPAHEREEQCRAASEETQPREPAQASPAHASITVKRSKVYSVRVSEGFKREIAEVLAELQHEHSQIDPVAPKLTGGELVELMLEVFKVCRANGAITSRSVSVRDEVWDGVRQIAQVENRSPAEMFEQLVVEKFAELGLESVKEG